MGEFAGLQYVVRYCSPNGARRCLKSHSKGSLLSLPTARRTSRAGAACHAVAIGIRCGEQLKTH